MPMSVKSAKNQLSLLASFGASYQKYIRKITDPVALDEDYEHIDSCDLDEMDIQWQMAMISIRA
ncbi:hypothetical protein Hanom_Chr09g00783351 [Helianthus anomalus]